MLFFRSFCWYTACICTTTCYINGYGNFICHKRFVTAIGLMRKKENIKKQDKHKVLPCMQGYNYLGTALI